MTAKQPQNNAQLTMQLIASVISCARSKFVGVVSAADATVLTGIITELTSYNKVVLQLSYKPTLTKEEASLLNSIEAICTEFENVLVDK